MLVEWTGWHFFTYGCCIFILIEVAKDTTSYHYCCLVLWCCLAVLPLLFDEWWICLTFILWAPSDQHAPPPCIQMYPFTQTPALLCCGSDTDPEAHLSHREIVPPLRIWNCHTMWRVSAWFPHSKGSVDGARDWWVTARGGALVQGLIIISCPSHSFC